MSRVAGPSVKTNPVPNPASLEINDPTGQSLRIDEQGGLSGGTPESMLDLLAEQKPFALCSKLSSAPQAVGLAKSIASHIHLLKTEPSKRAKLYGLIELLAERALSIDAGTAWRAMPAGTQSPPSPNKNEIVRLLSGLMAQEADPSLKQFGLVHLAVNYAEPAEVVRKAREEVAPEMPPYQAWLKDGVLKVAYFVDGEGSQVGTQLRNFQGMGFETAGKFPPCTLKRPAIGNRPAIEIEFKVGTEVFSVMNRDDIAIVAYSGHAGFGSVIDDAARNGQRGDGANKLVVLMQCSSVYNVPSVKAVYPKVQLIGTTEASVDAQDRPMFESILDGFSTKQSWDAIATNAQDALIKATVGMTNDDLVARARKHHFFPGVHLLQQVDSNRNGIADVRERRYLTETETSARPRHVQLHPLPAAAIDFDVDSSPKMLEAFRALNLLFRNNQNTADGTPLAQAWRDARVEFIGYADSTEGFAPTQFARFRRRDAEDLSAPIECEINPAFLHTEGKVAAACLGAELVAFLASTHPTLSTADVKALQAIAAQYAVQRSDPNPYLQADVYEQFHARYGLGDAYGRCASLFANSHSIGEADRAVIASGTAFPSSTPTFEWVTPPLLVSGNSDRLALFAYKQANPTDTIIDAGLRLIRNSRGEFYQLDFGLHTTDEGTTMTSLQRVPFSLSRYFTNNAASLLSTTEPTSHYGSDRVQAELQRAESTLEELLKTESVFDALNSLPKATSLAMHSVYRRLALLGEDFTGKSIPALEHSKIIDKNFRELCSNLTESEQVSMSVESGSLNSLEDMYMFGIRQALARVPVDNRDNQVSLRAMCSRMLNNCTAPLPSKAAMDAMFEALAAVHTNQVEYSDTCAYLARDADLIGWTAGSSLSSAISRPTSEERWTTILNDWGIFIKDRPIEFRQRVMVFAAQCLASQIDEMKSKYLGVLKKAAGLPN